MRQKQDIKRENEVTMKQEINPQETNRAYAFEMWMKSPMPMVTLTKTFDVTRLLKLSKRRGWKFTMLLCWCIGKAASRIEEFRMLPEGDKLYRYDKLAIDVIVSNRKGGINSCSIPYTEDLEQFNAEYLSRTQKVCESCENITIEDAMVIGTSAMVETELDSIVNQYSGVFNNPMVMWGKYRKGWFKTTLPISFQFHHTQMDGGDAARFLEELQGCVNEIK